MCEQLYKDGVLAVQEAALYVLREEEEERKEAPGACPSAAPAPARLLHPLCGCSAAEAATQSFGGLWMSILTSLLSLPQRRWSCRWCCVMMPTCGS